MLPVSTKWQQSIRQQFRYQGYLRITLQVTPPGLQEGVVVKSEDTDPVSDLQVLDDNAGGQPTPYITLERNRWLLNGKFKALRQGQKVDDWWATLMGSGSKVIDFTFDKTYSIPGLFVNWDPVSGTFPSSLLVKGYGADGGELYSYVVESITSSSGFSDIPMDNVKRVVLTIQGWNCDTWRPRVCEFLFGLYAQYSSEGGGRVTKGESYDYSDPLSSRLPTHTTSVQLRNTDQEFDPSLERGVSKYLARRQLVREQWGYQVSYGEIEWAPETVHYVDSFSIPSDSKEVEITTTSRLDLLTTDYKLSPYDGTSRTLFDLATQILQKSDIIVEGDEVPWQLAEGLKQMRTLAPVPKESSKVLLQLIAGAAAMWLLTDPITGYVVITDSPSDYLGELSKTPQLGDPQFDIQELLYRVTVGVYTYSASTEQTEVSSGTYTVSGKQELLIDYNVDFAKQVTCEISGATLVQFEPYGGSAKVIVQSNGASSEAKVVLKGYEVKSSVAFLEVYKNSSVTHGLTVEVDNPLITDTEAARRVGNWAVEWYGKRQKLSIPYTGFPELVAGDQLNVSTVYGDIPGATILGNRITFNGGFDGTLEVR